MRLFLKRTFIILITLLFLQGPEIIHQYKDHLKGHVEELKFQINELSRLSKTPERELREMISNWKDEVSKEFAGGLINRYEQLLKGLETLNETSSLFLPFVFLVNFDSKILGETLSSYRFGLSLSSETIFYGIVGCLLAYFLTALIQKRMKKLPPT